MTDDEGRKNIKYFSSFGLAMNATRWQRARKITQLISVVLFFWLALLTYRGAESLIPGAFQFGGK
jgi:hypothetical protein